MTVEEMETMAAEHGLAFLLDHLGLDGLGNEVVALHAEVERMRAAWEKDNTCGVCPYRQSVQAENARLQHDLGVVTERLLSDAESREDSRS